MQNYYKIVIIGFIIIFFTIPCALSQTSALKPQQLQLIVTPSEITLKVKEQFQFKAEIIGDDSIDISKVKFDWRVLGNIGTISSSTGLFTASDKPGRGMVSANALVDKKTLVGHAVVKIAEGVLPPDTPKKIIVVVKPSDVSLLPGESRQFTTEPVGKTQWRVIPPRLGSITDTGLFTASSSPGKGMVIATIQTADGTGIGRANVVIGKNEPITSRTKLIINISPKNAKIEKSGSVVFEAKIAGNNDNYPLQWDIYPKNLGYIEGMGDKVRFVAGTEEGRALITVQARSENEIGMDWATVDIGGTSRLLPEKLKVTVSPESASLKVGENISFAANISGNVNAVPSWSVAPSRIGIIDQNGLFTATGLGWGLVICKVETAKGIGVGQARVFVGAGNASSLQIIVSPQFAQVFTGGDTVKFMAQVKDKQNRPVTNVSILWKVLPEDMGTIDQTGLFTSGDKAGQALITAKIDGIEGGILAQARVTINEKIGKERLEVSIAGPQTLRLGETKEYQGNVTNQNGKPINLNTAQFEWRVVPASIGTITGNGDKIIFVPNVRGRGVIIVDVKCPEGAGTGRVSITIE